MKEDTKIIIGVVLGAIAFTSLICFLIWFGVDNHDRGCLTEIAINYCENNNLTYFLSEGLNQGKNHFICKEDIDLRNNPYGSQLSFYFLPEESSECLIKSKWSFGLDETSEKTANGK